MATTYAKTAAMASCLFCGAKNSVTTHQCNECNAPMALVHDALAQKREPRIVSILGASLPEGIEPDTDDQVTMEGQTYEILAVKRDPAAALYECLVER